MRSTGKMVLIYALIAYALLLPAAGISVSCSSLAAGETASSMESFDLDSSTLLHENLALGSGRIAIDRQAEGQGNNRLKQTLNGDGYTLQNGIESQGSFSSSTSAAALSRSASLRQNVGGVGNLNLELRGVDGDTDGGQEARVNGGILISSQSLSAGVGINARQSTEISGQEGTVISGALGEENVALTQAGFSGTGSLSARLSSSAGATASASGYAAIDDTVLLNDDSSLATLTEGRRGVMGMAGTRLTEGERGGIGSFDLTVLNLERQDTNSPNSQERSGLAGTAGAQSGGSYSSYALTGYRWNEKNPQVQLYLNPTDTPSGLTVESSKNAISAAANTWDNAVEQNVFRDGSTVIVDYSKVVDNPFVPQGQQVRDGYSVNGWKSLGNNYLGLERWWSDGRMVDGYYSIVEADGWYNRDYPWTTDLYTAQSTDRIDLESIALHELGHGIGMDDLYQLPASDPRKNDFQQVMNLYNGPQRGLGNGDLEGARRMYGTSDSSTDPSDNSILYRMWNPYITDHLYTTNSGEYNSGAINYGYGKEGVIGTLYSGDNPDSVPLYRMWNQYITDHLYTTNHDEYNSGAVSCGYTKEGIIGYIYNIKKEGTIALYRLWNPQIKDHLYTTSYSEYSTGAVSYGYQKEGIVGYIGPFI